MLYWFRRTVLTGCYHVHGRNVSMYERTLKPVHFEAVVISSDKRIFGVDPRTETENDVGPK